MRNTTFLLGALATFSFASLAAAQQPNLSGHWIQQAPGGPPPQGDGGGGRGGARGGGRGNPQGAGTFGNEFLAVQDANSLTIRRVDTQTGDTLSSTFKFDGTETHNRALFGGGYQPAHSLSIAKWANNRLTITSYPADAEGARSGGPQARPIVTIVWMQGRQLKVDTTRPQGQENNTSMLSTFNKR